MNYNKPNLKIKNDRINVRIKQYITTHNFFWLLRVPSPYKKKK